MEAVCEWNILLNVSKEKWKLGVNESFHRQLVTKLEYKLNKCKWNIWLNNSTANENLVYMKHVNNFEYNY